MENQFQEPDLSQIEATPTVTSGDDSGATLPQTEIQRALQKNEASLMAIEGVVGVGIQQDAIGDETIVVYLRDEAAKQRIPKAIDGYRLMTVVTGEFDAQ